MKLQTTKKLLIILLFTAALFGTTIAQNATVNDTYAAILDDMQRLYETGKMVDVRETFYQKCCRETDKKGEKVYIETTEFRTVNKEIKARIYELVSLAIISSNEPTKSRPYLSKLFAIEYNKTFTDSWLAIRAEREKYLIIPKLSIGVVAGLTLSEGNILKSRSFMNQTGTETAGGEKKYELGMGNSLGVIVNHRFSKNFLINVGVRTNKVNFSYTVDYIWSDEGGNNITFKNIHTNNFRYIEYPLNLKFELQGKLRPFVQAGVFYGTLQMAQRSMVYTVAENIHGFKMSNTYPKSINTDEQLLPYNFGYSFATGLEFTIGKSCVLFSAYMQKGAKDVVNQQFLYTNKDLMYHFYDIFDNMKISNYGINATYLYSINYGAYLK